MRAGPSCSVRRSVRPSVRPARAPAPAPTPRPPPPARARPACGPRPRPRRAPAAADWPAPRPGRGHRPGPRPRRPGRAPRFLLGPLLRAAEREGARRGSVLLRPPVGGRTAEVRAGARWALWEAPSPGQAGGGGGGAAWGLRAPAPLPAGQNSRDPRGWATRVRVRAPSRCLTAHPGPAPPRQCLGGARVSGPQAVPTPRRAVARRASLKLRDFARARAALRARRCATWARKQAPAALRPHAAGSLGTARPRLRGTSAHEGEAHLGERATSQCMSLGLRLGQLRSTGGHARWSFPPLRLSGGVTGPAVDHGSRLALPARGPVRPSSPNTALQPSGGRNGNRGPAFLAGLCGGKGHLASSPRRCGGKGGEPVAGQPRRGVEQDPAIQWGGAAGRLRPASLRAQRRGIPREVGGAGPLWMLSQDV